MSTDDGATGRGRELDALVGDTAAVREVFEATPVALAYLHGPELRFAATNAAYRAMWDRGALVGLTMREALHELDSQYLFEVAERVLHTGEPVDAREWRVPVQLDGVLVEKYFNFQIQPRRDATGGIQGVLIQVVDVTSEVQQRMRAEEVARDAERRYRAARDVVAELQQALLPAGLPLVPGLDLSASYLPANDDATVGGDWFDAVVRPDGLLVVVVGDVVGHGVVASAVMGQLRAVLHERLLAGVRIDEALTHLDAYASSIPDSHATTVCVAEIDRDSGEVTYCTAGHPPPLVIGADRTSRFLPTSGAGPLSTRARFTTATTVLGADDVLVLYSDGLVERPGRDAAESTVELTQVAAHAFATDPLQGQTAMQRTTERVCRLTPELLTRTTGHADDITILAAQRVREVAPLVLSTGATPDAVREVRLALSEWLTALHANALDVISVQHGVAELVANAVEHAYADAAPQQVHLEVRLERDGTLLAAVSDEGEWRDEQREGGGRGLALTSDLSDALEFERQKSGTTVTMRRRLTRPAQMLLDGTSQPTPVSAGTPFDVEVDDAAGTARVHGPLDLTTAERFRRALVVSTRGGSRTVTVDLSRVTLLASKAVQALYELGDSVRLVAPPGTPAQHILEMVDLPYVHAPDI